MFVAGHRLVRGEGGQLIAIATPRDEPTHD
jgi:hypothetical protein